MNEETIFAQAVQIADADERQVFVDKVCADDAKLRADVEALLKSHAQARSFLEVPALEASRPTVISDVSAENGTTAVEDDLRFLQPSDAPDSIGRLGQYEVLSEIGRGGLGVVLKARDAALGRIVAIKVPASEYAANALVRKRFMREAQAAAAVSHDHVVTIHAVGEENGIPYLVMELVDGISLQQKIDREGPLELKEILRIGSQTACGLAAAHKQGLVHRDVKPANVLLENGVQRVKLTDFGLARAVDDVSITQTGTVAGTPQYMSPEQAHGRQVDHRSDLFSLGSVLYAMCTGRPAFRADSTMAVLKRVCDDAPKSIRNVNPEVPEWLCEIVDKLMEKEPGDRFESAEEVAELLNRHLAHLQQPESVPQPAMIGASGARSQPADLSSWDSRIRKGALAVLAIAVLYNLSGVLRAIQTPEAPGPAELAVILFIFGAMFAVPIGLAVWIVSRIRRTEARETKPQLRSVRTNWFLAGIGILFLLAMIVGFSGLVNIRSMPGGAELAVNLFVLAGMLALPVGLIVWIVSVLRRAEVRAEIQPRSPERVSAPESGPRVTKNYLETSVGRELNSVVFTFAAVGMACFFAAFLAYTAHDQSWYPGAKFVLALMILGTLIVFPIVIFAGIRLNWLILFNRPTGPLPLLASRIALIPWNPLLLLTLPFAIRAYHILHRPDVIELLGVDPTQVQAGTPQTAGNASTFSRWCRRYHEHRSRWFEAVVAVAVVLFVGYWALWWGDRLDVGARFFALFGGNAPQQTNTPELHADRTIALQQTDGQPDWQKIDKSVLSPDQKSLAVIASAGEVGRDRITVFDVATGKQRFTTTATQRAVAFSPDGTTMAFCGTKSERNSFYGVWLADATTGEKQTFLSSDFQPMNTDSMTFDPQGRRLAVAHTHNNDVPGGWEGMVTVWDVETKKELRMHRGLHFWVRRVLLPPQGNRLVALGSGGEIVLWEDDRQVATYNIDLNVSFLAAAFSPDGQSLAVCGVDDDGHSPLVSICDLRSGKIREFPTRHRHAIRSVVFSPDGRQFATGDTGAFTDPKIRSTIRVHDLSSGCETAVLVGHESWIEALAFREDGTILSVGRDGTVKTWMSTKSQESSADAVLEKPFVQLADTWKPGGNDWPILDVDISPDGKWLASGHRSGQMILWEVSRQGHSRLTSPVFGDSGPVHDVAFSPDSRFIAWVELSGKLQITGASNLQNSEVNHFERFDKPLRCLAWSNDAKTIVTGSQGKLLFWDNTKGGKPAAEVDVPDGAMITSVAYSPDGTQLATGGSDGHVLLWDVTRPTPEVVTDFVFHVTETKTKTAHQGDVKSLAFSPDGTVLVSGGADGRYRFLNLAKPDRDHLAETSDVSPVNSISFSPDGSVLAMTGHKTISVQSGDRSKFNPILATLREHNGGHSDEITAAVFTRDGKHLISGSEDGTIKWWEFAEPLAPQQAESAPAEKPLVQLAATWGSEFKASDRTAVLGLDVSEDSKWALSSHQNGDVHLWNVADGRDADSRLVGSWGSNGQPAWDIAFSPNGGRFTWVQEDGWLSSIDYGIKDARLWTGGVLPRFEQTESPLRCLAYAPDGKTIVTGSVGKLLVWDPEKGGDAIATLDVPGGGNIVDVRYSPNGRWLASGGDNGKVFRWNVAERIPADPHEIEHFSWQAHVGRVAGIVWTKEQNLTTAGYDGYVREWDDAEENDSLSYHRALPTLRAFAIAPDEQARAAGGILAHRNTPLLMRGPFDNDHNLPRQHPDGHKANITSLVFTPDGRYLLSGGEDGMIKVWEFGERLAAKKAAAVDEPLTDSVPVIAPIPSSDPG